MHLDGPLTLAAEAVRHGRTDRRARANLSANFRNGEATVRADGAVGEWAVRAAGTVRPLGEIIGCALDLEADVPPIDPWGRNRAPGRALAVGRLTGSLRAERVGGAPASARAELDFEPDSPRHSIVGPGRVALSLERGVGVAAGGVE